MDNKMDKPTPYICSSERQFLELRGDGSESVKVTINFDNPTDDLNGWYVFYRQAGKENLFARQSRKTPQMIERILCESEYLEFDRNAGILPNIHHYRYVPLMPNRGVEYDLERLGLEKVGEWRQSPYLEKRLDDKK